MIRAFPALVIGPESFAVAKDLGHYLLTINNKNIREVVSLLTLSHPRNVLLTDAAMLTGMAASVLLKFVEEYQGKLIVHMSVDVVSVVLLSRFRTVVKGGTVPVIDDETQVYLRDPGLLAVRNSNLPSGVKVRVLGRV